MWLYLSGRLVHRIPLCPSWPEERCKSQKCIGHSMEGPRIRQAAIAVLGLAPGKGLSNTRLQKSIKVNIVIPCCARKMPFDTLGCRHKDAWDVKETGHVHQIGKLPAIWIELRPQLPVIPCHTCLMQVLRTLEKQADGWTNMFMCCWWNLHGRYGLTDWRILFQLDSVCTVAQCHSNKCSAWMQSTMQNMLPCMTMWYNVCTSMSLSISILFPFGQLQILQHTNGSFLLLKR